jgi:protocatechuate 4,5-dioxygenase, beta chain
MAHIVGAIGCTHVPSIGGAMARGLQKDPYWAPFFDGFPAAHRWLAETQPDVAVVLYNDHGLNFFLDNLPTFAVGAADSYRNEDEGWGIPALGSFPGHPALSWHLIESLVADEFDPATCQQMLVDHAFTLPLKLLWPGDAPFPVRTVPVHINTVQFPLPSPRRCYHLGQSLGRAIRSFPEDLRVVLVATGGLSHQLDGTRAGFINRRFDLECLDQLLNDPSALARLSVMDLVRHAGTQGVEIMAWLAARAALEGTVRQVYRNYHIPISNTAAGLLVLANEPAIRRTPAAA